MKTFLLALMLILPVHVSAETVVSHNMSVDQLKDENPGYEAELLILSLDKTKPEYGEYSIKPVRDDMNYARRVEMMSTNRYENLIRAIPYSEELSAQKDLIHSHFPVFLGILGYRTCFISEKIKTALTEVDSAQDLLKFTHGQKKGWLDISILRHNGFKVSESSNYTSLFKMVAANRFDLFCRGANEVLVEYSHHKQGLAGFEYDRSLAIYYPLPHFFYAHKSDADLIDRVSRGLEIAYKDGSVFKLWSKYYKKSVDFVALEKRQIFYFENPYLTNLDATYEQFVFRP